MHGARLVIISDPVSWFTLSDGHLGLTPDSEPNLPGGALLVCGLLPVLGASLGLHGTGRSSPLDLSREC